MPLSRTFIVTSFSLSFISIFIFGFGTNDVNNFTGVFDGNYNIISNAVSNQSGSDYIGVFGYVGSGGQIRNLGVENVNITGNNYVGGLVGLNGTSGTLTGAGRYLRQVAPGITLVAVQPDAAFHGLEGLKHMPTAIQPGFYDPGLPDRFIEVSTEEAYTMVRRLAREEGLFVGISSGAAAVAALKTAGELSSGWVVAIFPDAGYKYLSDKLWEQ